MKMNLENTVEGGFEYEKRVWAARCKSEKGAGCSEGRKTSYGGGETRKKNSKPNSGLKTKWIEYSKYVGRW